MNEKTMVTLIKMRREFAERLHGEFCRLSHMDRCAWDYEKMYSPDSGWTQRRSAHNVWYDKASKVLSVFAGYTEDQMIDLIRFVRENV